MEQQFLINLKTTPIDKKMFYILSFVNQNKEKNIKIILNNFELILNNLRKVDLKILYSLILIVKNENTIDFFSDNIDIIIEKSDYEVVSDLIFKILDEKDASKFLKTSCLNKVLKTLSHDDIFKLFFKNKNLSSILEQYLNYLLKTKNNIISLEDIIVILLSFPNCEQILIENIDYIMNNIDNIYKLKEKLGFNKQLLNIINEYMNVNIDKTIHDYVNTSLSYFDINKDEEDDFTNVFEMIFKEIVENEKIKISDVETITGGRYSYVYKIGEKVLKIGTMRQTFLMPNNKRFLKPLIRRKLDIKTDKGIIPIVIEATEYVDVNNITTEDVYLLYKELRDEHYIWTDPRIENVGRLKKPNKNYLNYNTYISNDSINYINNDIEILNQGELVIIDNDFIYPEDYTNIKYGNNYYFSIYEKRYQEEKNIKNK
ncbi:MAG: hypothetical protein PHN42_04445 [Bacilli bacterium]|nr:hypothetical protein [Bacilli bacterium]